MAQQPLLIDGLTLAERITLGSLAQQPGFMVLVKIMNAACERATADVIKLEPSEEGYQRKLMAFQTRARNINEFSSSVLKSIDWQVQFGVVEQANQKEAENPSKDNRK